MSRLCFKCKVVTTPTPLLSGRNFFGPLPPFHWPIPWRKHSLSIGIQYDEVVERAKIPITPKQNLEDYGIKKSNIEIDTSFSWTLCIMPVHSHSQLACLRLKGFSYQVDINWSIIQGCLQNHIINKRAFPI